MRRFDLVLPNSLEDCLKILAERGRGRQAGGRRHRPPAPDEERPAQAGLRGGPLRGRPAPAASSAPNGSGLRIGAAVTARALEREPARPGGLSRARRERRAGRLASRCATWRRVGGNLCNAAPSADMAPPLLALEAEAVIAGPRGERRVPLAVVLHRRPQDGARARRAAGRARRAPRPGAHSGGNYLRHTPRRELDIAVVGVASQLTLAERRLRARRASRWPRWRPTPVRATAAEQALEGQPVTPELIERAAALAVEAARPISDQRGSVEFRRHLVRS